MSINEIRVGDVGTLYKVTVRDENDDPVDVSTAAVKQFIFRKPDATQVTRSADFITDGKDGQLGYYFQDGDLDKSGLWQAQVYVEWDADNKWKSDILTFEVHKNL